LDRNCNLLLTEGVDTISTAAGRNGKTETQVDTLRCNRAAHFVGSVVGSDDGRVMDNLGLRAAA